MIGIDIVKVDRISSAMQRHGDDFLKRFLNQNEINLAKSANSIAGFWAAKEACSKALGVGIGASFSFYDVEIYKNDLGAPKLKFSPQLIKKFNIKESSVSITHDGGFAVAAVMIV